VNPVYDELQENPALARWDTMERNRSLFGDADVPPEIRFDGVSVKRSRDEETGKETVSFAGGPKIKVARPDGSDFTYVTAEGQQKPFGNVSLFTFTSKMSCPSFSLPAGPTKHGTCPASKPDAIQAEGSYTKFHPPLEKMPAGETFICDVCYAGKNRYLQYKSMSLGQMAKYRWVLNALRAGTFAAQMTQALYMLLHPKIEDLLRANLVSNQFFRIHDSGDFFSTSYYQAWVEVCENFMGKLGGKRKSGPLIYFWAPTRMWVYEKYRKAFLADPPPPNLALRPSALFTGVKPPLIPGFAAGSTSVAGKMPEPTWNCPAYEDDAPEASCAGVKCRVCWTLKKRGVNYTTH
jgi:hypothetical protein